MNEVETQNHHNLLRIFGTTTTSKKEAFIARASFSLLYDSFLYREVAFPERIESPHLAVLGTQAQ